MPFSYEQYLAIRPFLPPALGAFVGFLLGFVAFSVNERLKARKEGIALCRLFRHHIQTTWTEVDALAAAPPGPQFSRLTMSVLGLRTGGLTGTPEYAFPVDDLDLFRTHGLQLARLANAEIRKQFWVTYKHLRGAEATRLQLRSMPTSDPDYLEYQRLFLTLVTLYRDDLLALAKVLDRALPRFSSL